MKLGPGFKPDTGAGFAKPINMQEAQEKLKKWMRDQYAHYHKQREDFLELHLRRFIPGFVVDRIILRDTMIPAWFFGVFAEGIEFEAEGISVIQIRRFGKLVAAKIFIPPSSYITKDGL